MEQQIETSPEVEQAAYVIAGWLINPSTLRIHNADKTVKLEPKVMAVLQHLAERPGEVISRQELEENIWTGTVVGYDAISNAIIKLRKAFDDDAQNPQVIETIPKSGYRLIAAVEPTIKSVSPDLEPKVSVEAATADQAVIVNVKTDTSHPGSRWKLVITISAPLLLLVALVALVFKPWENRLEPASINSMALPLPDKPSIAVLPFTNISSDPEQEYFVDGMTEDLITDLSKLSGLFVVARNSVFTYKGKAVKIRDVAEDLGVQYVLEGSVRRVGDQVRINAQLIDALSGGHLWADRYDGTFGDVFALTDKVSNSIVEQLAVNLSIEGDTAVKSVEPNYAKAYDLFLKGWGYYRSGSPGDYRTAIEIFNQVLEIDPDFKRAHAALAATYWNIMGKGYWQESLGIHYYSAFELARLALRRSQQNPTVLTHQIASEWAAFYSKGSTRRALVEAKAAVELDPNDPAGHLAMAVALLKGKDPDAAEKSMRTAMRLDPHFPPQYLVRIAQAQFQLGDYMAAIESLQTVIARSPEDSWAFVYLAASYGQLDEIEKANQALIRANEIRADTGWGPVTIVLTSHPNFRWHGDREALKQGLRKAGAPTGGEWYKLITFESVDGEERKGGVKGATTINAAEAKTLHERGVLFVDTQFTWLNQRIPGSYFLEWWSTEGWIFNEVSLGRLAAKDQEIVIYAFDTSSKFSTFATALAVSRGFEKIYFFEGGLNAWKEAGYPIETAK